MSTQLTKRTLFSKGALSAGVGLGTLALFQQHASADTPFTAFAFAATGAPTPRTMPDRLAEVINVKDFGAVGDGRINDTDAIQAAFDAAFKTGGTPHGLNGYLNRAVYFPGGRYLCNNLMLTQVYGGRIYGAGQNATILQYNGPHPTRGAIGPILSTNGFAFSTIENMQFGCYGRETTKNTICIDLNWDGTTGTVGLNNCALINVSVGGSKYGLRIAESGVDGRAISLSHCNVSEAYYGVKLNSDDCSVTTIGGGVGECFYGVWVNKGSFSWSGTLGAGGFRSAFPTFPGQTDILHNSTGISTLMGARSESQYCVYATAGKVNLVGMMHNISTPDNYTVDGTGGANTEVSLNSCYLGDLGGTNTGAIRGNVTLSLRNVYFARERTGDKLFSSFTGKIANYVRSTPFTMATLPPNPADGLMVSVTNANASGGWGSNVTGTGSDHALLRWNAGTSQWTLVGK